MRRVELKKKKTEEEKEEAELIATNQRGQKETNEV